jgi:hypothetical protein
VGILTAAVRDETSGEVVGVLVLNETTFKTGSRGYRGLGKITIDGQRYQCQAQLVAIGNRPQGGGDR